jgi:hypothetical protein
VLTSFANQAKPKREEIDFTDKKIVTFTQALLSEHSINDFSARVHTPEVEWGGFGTLPTVELQLFAVYDHIFDGCVLNKLLFEAAFLAFYVKIFKGEVAGTCSALGDGHVIEYLAHAGAVLDGDVVYLGGKTVVLLLSEQIEIDKASRLVTMDVFHSYVFVVLGGVVAELEPKQIYGFVYVTVADDDVFVVDGLGSAGQSSVAEAVVAILNQDTLIFAVFGKLVGIYALATLEHHRVVVDVEVAVLDEYVVANVYINGVGAWRSDRGVRSEDLTIQIPYVIALVDVS